jgi:hypothetical protein
MRLPDLSKLSLTSHVSTNHISVDGIVATPTTIHSFTSTGYQEFPLDGLESLAIFATQTTNDSVRGANNTVLKPPFQPDPPPNIKQWLQATHGVSVDSVVFRATTNAVSAQNAAQEMLLTLHAAEKGVGVYVYAAMLSIVDGGARLVMVLERGLSFSEAAQPTLVTPTVFALLQSATKYLFQRFSEQSYLLLVDARVDNIVIARDAAFFIDFDPRFSSISPSWTPFERRWVACISISVDVLLNHDDDDDFYQKFFTGPLRFAMTAMRQESQELIGEILQTRPVMTMPEVTLFDNPTPTMVGTLLSNQLNHVLNAREHRQILGQTINTGITLEEFYNILRDSDDDDLGTEMEFVQDETTRITREGTVLDS